MCLGILMEKAAAGRVIVTPAVLAQLSTKAGEELNKESGDGLFQKVLSGKAEKHLHQQLAARLAKEGGVREEARLASPGLPHAADWLHVLPSRALGLLRSQELVMVVMNIYEKVGPCPACQRPGDLPG